MQHAQMDRTDCWGRQSGRQPVVQLAWPRPVVEILRLPRCNSRVVHCESHIGIHAVRIGRRRRSGKQTSVDQVDPAICRGACVPVLDLLLDLLVVMADQVGEALNSALVRGPVEAAERGNPYLKRSPRSPVSCIRSAIWSPAWAWKGKATARGKTAHSSLCAFIYFSLKFASKDEACWCR